MQEQQPEFKREAPADPEGAGFLTRGLELPEEAPIKPVLHRVKVQGGSVVLEFSRPVHTVELAAPDAQDIGRGLLKAGEKALKHPDAIQTTFRPNVTPPANFKGGRANRRSKQYRGKFGKGGDHADHV